MRRYAVLPAMLVVALTGFVGAGIVTAGGAGAKTAKPSGVDVDGKVNARGVADVAAKASPTLEVKETEYSISPTYVKVAQGQELVLKVHNTGKVTHTFTSDDLGVDERLKAGRSKTITVTVPKGAGTVQIWCSLHDGDGMRAALYTSAAATTPTTSPRSSGSDSGRGSYDY